MWRYLTTLAATLVTTFGLVWIWVATMPIAFLDAEYPAWLAKRQMLARCDLGELVIVGDSRAAVDIMPALLPIRATNLAVGGGSSIEAYAAITEALACSEPPRRVLVSFDAAHFTQPDLFWERSVRFGFIGSAHLRELRRVSDALDDRTHYELRSAGLAPALRAKLAEWRFPSFYFNSLVKGGVLLRWPRNRQVLAETLAARGQYFFGTSEGSSIVGAEGSMKSFAPLPVLDHYFDRMLALLAERGIAVDFVAMPMNHATWRIVRPEVRDGFAAYLAALAARHATFRIVGEVMPHWPDRWFGDGFGHLNPAGATRFSATLADWLSSAAGGAAQHAERGAIGMVE